MSLHIVTEALARIEHKIDALLKALKVKPQPMEFVGDPCPGCGHLVQYQIDPVHNVVVRRCGCKTGKVPPTFQLVPVNTQLPSQGAEPNVTEESEDTRPRSRNGRRNS